MRLTMVQKAPRIPRSRSARATRQRLYEAGARAFARKGLAAAHLKDDILQPAGVSVGSFYHQFPDKTALLLALLEDRTQAFRDQIREANLPRPGRSLREITRISYDVLFDFADASADILRILIRERDSQDAAVRAFLAEDRRRWVAMLSEVYERLGESTGAALDGRLTATLIVGLSTAALAQYFETPAATRPAKRQWLHEGLVEFTLAGVPGLARDAKVEAPSDEPSNEGADG